jgi:hypothetical protein
MLDLRKLKDLDLDPGSQAKDCCWKLIITAGDDKPGNLAFHSSVVFGDKMYLFGGSNQEYENTKFYVLDLATFKWELIKSRGDLPLTRDEHTAVISPIDNTMIIYGGFCDGSKTDSIIRFSF